MGALKILVVGGTGTVGSRVTRELVGVGGIGSRALGKPAVYAGDDLGVWESQARRMLPSRNSLAAFLPLALASAG